MIVGSLYPDKYSVPMGYEQPWKMAQCTENFGQTYDSQTVNSADSYFLGYISADDMPRAFGMSIIYMDEDEGIIFKSITDAQNFPCGYVYNLRQIVVDPGEKNYIMYTDINGTKTIPTQADNTIRLFNQNFPMFSGRSAWSDTALTLYFLAAFFDGTGDPVSEFPYAVGGIYSQITNVGDVIKFFNGEYDVTVNLGTYGQTQLQTTINAGNFAAGSAYLPVENTQWYVRLVCVNFDAGTGAKAYAGGIGVNCPPQFMVKTNGSYGENSVEKLSCGSAPIQTAYTYSVNWIESQAPTEENPVFVSGIAMSGEFTHAQLWTDIVQSRFVFNGNMCFYRTSSGVDSAPVFDLEEIKKSFYLSYRGDTTVNGHTAGYVANVTYATDVNAENRFLANWKTGNLEDAAFKSGLRDWQWTNDGFQDDKFDESDVPPYEPPGPEPRPDPEDPGDDETAGDEIEFNDPSGLGNGFGFTTMYGIRAAHLQEIGAKLWTGFNDINDYINNFVFAVDPDTGSVNFADIMQFFISLRAYPCPLSAMATTTAGGTDMYIGSGAAPMTLSTPFSVVSSYIGHLDAGSVSLPYWYGDFRDFGLQIICYLPYCGTLELNPGDVMGGTLSAFYTVDFCSGACVAYVTCTTWEGATILVGSLPGQLGAEIPMTATNAGQVAARMYGDRINVAQTLLGALKSGVTGVGAIMSGNWAGATRSGLSAMLDPAIEMEKHYAEMGSRSAIAAPMLSGGRGLSGFGTVKSAYVQIRSPYYADPSNYGHSVGYPAADYVQIGSCSGFCQFVNVDVSGVTTDADDQQAIKSALESGVYI